MERFPRPGGALTHRRQGRRWGDGLRVDGLRFTRSKAKILRAAEGPPTAGVVGFSVGGRSVGRFADCRIRRVPVFVGAVSGRDRKRHQT